MTGYNATVGEDTGYYASGKPVTSPGYDCYFALETEGAAAYKHYYKWRSIPIAARGAYKLPLISSWVSVSSSIYVSVAGYRWCTVNDGASMPWASGTEFASNAGAPVDLAWNALLNAAKTRWLSMSIGGVSGSLVVEKADETHYLFLPVGDYWSSTSSHYLHLESGGAKQFRTTDPPANAYLRSVKFGFDGIFDDPDEGGEI